MILTLALAITSSFAGAEPAFSATSSHERCLVNKINHERRSRDAGTVAMRSDLTAIARDWSRRMAATGDISHNSNLGRQVKGDWTRIGENVGVGYGVKAIHAGFMSSRSHRAVILQRRFNHAGVGISVDKAGMTYITEVFARRTGGSQPSTRCDGKVTYTGARSGVQGQRAHLAARLSDVSGAVPGKAIDFRVAGLSARAVTDADGVARASIRMKKAPGSYVVTARCAGSSVMASEGVSSKFVVLWPHTFRDRIGKAAVHLNPSTKEFLVILPGERNIIRRAYEMETYSVTAGRAVTSLSYQEGAVAFDGFFDQGSGDFALVYRARMEYRILRKS